MKTIMEAMIVSHGDIVSRVAAMREDEQTIVICRGIAKWLVAMSKRPKPKRFLCLDCDTSFHVRRMPEAFAVTLPFMRDGEQVQVVTTGICRRCAEKKSDALLQKFVEGLRAYYPDLTIIKGGQA